MTVLPLSEIICVKELYTLQNFCDNKCGRSSENK